MIAKKETIRWLSLWMAIILVLATVAGVVTAVILVHKADEPEEILVQAEPEETYTAAINDFQVVGSEASTGPVKLSLAFTDEAPVIRKLESPLRGAVTTVSKTITATVLPATAANTQVDWSVTWGGSQSGTVTDYITVTSASDGSTTATVTCQSPFSGEIVIVCTTREGGYIATCTVTFAGHPTDMSFSSNATLSDDAYHLGIGVTYDFSIALDNPFHSVGSQFHDFSVTVTGVGQIEVGDMDQSRSGSRMWYQTSFHDISLDSIKDNFIYATCSNGTLFIQTKQAIESYYRSSQIIDSGRTITYSDKFHAFSGDCYFNVTVTENRSGISQTIKVVFDESTVTGVSVSITDMEF